MIHKELCKKLKFDHTTKWYKHKLESAQKNAMNKILSDFEINQILLRITDLNKNSQEKNEFVI